MPALEDPLAHVVGRLDVERRPSHDPQRPECDHDALEVRGTTAVRTISPLEVTSSSAATEVARFAVAVPGTVRRGRDRPGHGDVRQRRQVVQRDTLAIESTRQLGSRSSPAANETVEPAWSTTTS